MKTKIPALSAFILAAMLLTASAASAQQVQNADPRTLPLKGNINASGNYSFKLYQAPNKAFGYDIWKDGKPVYHQFAIVSVSKQNKPVFATKPQAEKAAGLAIEKIKKGTPPALSDEEIKQVMNL